jgi:hypothetical protein
MAIIITEEITEADLVPVITDEWEQGDYEDLLFPLEAGKVFTFDKAMNFETVASNIALAKAQVEGINMFEFCYIAPGSTMYSLYGPNYCMVTHTG